MKNSIIVVVFLLGLVLAGCGNKEKEQAQLEKIRQDSIRVADSIAMVQQTMEKEKQRAERRKIMESGDTFVAEISDKAEAGLEGKVIIISEEGETIPFRMEGSKVLAITMPDGKLYQVEEEGDKIMLMVPGKGNMEKKQVNGKIYLVDNEDQMYEVKVSKNRLVAVLSSGTEVKLAKR